MEPGKLRGIRLRDYLIRFVLGAVISIVAGLIGELAGARVGGTFLAFPAILPASLTLIQEREGSRRADRDAVGAVLGGVALVVFATVAETALTRILPVFALIGALAGWLAAALALYALLAWLNPDACDQQQD